jgi:hypothetical protein
MDALIPADAHCPYCGEPLQLLVDPSVEQQRYVEDCAVCCRPIEVAVSIGADGQPHLRVATGDDA